jgi:hypothetical protein
MSGFAAGMAFEGMANDIANRARSRAHLSDIEEMAEIIAGYREDNAGNLAEKTALREALAKFDPNHPLIKDRALVEQIHRTAARVVSSAKFHWDDVREVGKTLRYQYTPPPSTEQLQQRVQQLEDENVQNYAEKCALRQSLRRIDKEHPLLIPTPDVSPLHASLRKKALTAFSLTGDYDAVRKVAEEATYRFPYDPFRPPQESILESYNGEIPALIKHVEYIRDEVNQARHSAMMKHKRQWEEEQARKNAGGAKPDGA